MIDSTFDATGGHGRGRGRGGVIDMDLMEMGNHGKLDQEEGHHVGKRIKAITSSTSCSSSAESASSPYKKNPHHHNISFIPPTPLVFTQNPLKEHEGVGDQKEQAQQQQKHDDQQQQQQHLVSYKTRATILSCLIVFIGIIAGMLCIGLGIRSARQQEQAELTKEADEITKSVQATWNEFRVTGLWMHETCNGRRNKHKHPSIPIIAQSIGCTREEFQNYYNHISSSGLTFESVFFMPNVTYQERMAVEEESRQYFETEQFEDTVNYLGFVKAVFNPETGQFGPVPLPYYNETAIAAAAALGDEEEEKDNSDVADLFVGNDEQAEVVAVDEEIPRSWYFPSHYMLPIEGSNVLFMDSDMTFSSAIWPFIESAIIDKKPKITFPLPKSVEDYSFYVQFFHPGIDPNSLTTIGTTTEDYEDNDPQYNAVGVVMVRICNLVSRAVGTKSAELNVYIYDVTNTAAGAYDATDSDAVSGSFMCGVHIHGNSEMAHSGGNTLELPPVERKDARIWKSDRKYFRETEISIEDRTWLVLVADPEQGGKYQESQFLVPLIGGIVIIIASTIMAIWFHRSTTRVTKLQQLQAESEREKALLLQNVNVELNRQVQERLEELREKERIAQEKSREAAQAEAKSESMIETMSMLSHELRTPLQGIMGVTTMVLEDINSSMLSSGSSQGSPAPPAAKDTSDDDAGSADDRIEENLYTIQASSQLLLTLINNLLDVRKIDAGMMDDESFVLECIDLKGTIQQCVDTLKPLATLSDVKLKIGTDVVMSGKNGRNYGDRFWLVKGGTLLVQQVLINLVGNAIKYSGLALKANVGDSTRLDVTVREATLEEAYIEAMDALCTSADRSHEAFTKAERRKKVLIVDVRDRGNGIPLDEAHKVFGAFMMLKKHRSNSMGSHGFAQPTGSGLGLQLCTRIMDRMNGCVWGNNCDSPKASGALKSGACGQQANVDSRGCVFSFYLECPSSDEEREYMRSIAFDGGSACSGGVRKPVSSIQLPDSIPTVPSDSSLNKSGEGSWKNVINRSYFLPPDLATVRVFVIDDVVINGKVICKMLHRLGFRDVHCFTSGLRALETLQEDPKCDLILTDYQMPGMDGLEFAVKTKELYKKLDKPSPPIVLCSADYSSKLRAQCVRSGIERMLRKPLTIADLTHFVKENQATESE